MTRHPGIVRLLLRRRASRWRAVAALAAGKEGKVPVKKTIIHKGKSMEVTYWVKAEKAKKISEKKDADAAPAPAPAPPKPAAAPAPAGGGGEAPKPAAGAAKKGPPPGTVPVKKTLTTKGGKSFEVTYHMTPKAAKKAHEKAVKKAAAEGKPPPPEPDWMKQGGAPAASKPAAPMASQWAPKPPASGGAPSSSAGTPVSTPALKSVKLVRSTVENGGLKGAYDAVETIYGADGVTAKKAVASWAGSAIAKEAVQLRGAVAEDFDREAKHIKAAGSHYSEAEIIGQLKVGANSPKIRRAAAALAAVSQSMYEEEYVTLYRGIKERQAKHVANDAKEVATGSLVSFSESAQVADDFAESNGKVLKVRVPRSAIAVSYRAFEEQGSHGSLLTGEQEVILRTNGVVPVTVLSKAARKAAKDAAYDYDLKYGKQHKKVRKDTPTKTSITPSRSVALLRSKVAGRRRAAKYEEALIENATAAASKAFAASAGELRAAVSGARGLAEAKRRLPAILRRMDVKKPAEVVFRALMLSAMSGYESALEEV